jgi:rubredoxin
LHNDSFPVEERHLGILDFFRGRKKSFAVDDDADRHHVDSLDYFEEKESHLHCPECAKAQKHVRLVETEGEALECPECHYLQETRRI